MPVKRWWFEAAAIAIALGLIAILLQRLSTSHGLVTAAGQPLFGDFIAFWSGGRAALDGHIDQVHDRTLIFQYHQAAAPGVRYVAPWNSPPTFLLIAAPLALLPFPVAAILFLVGSAALYFYAARKILPDARALIFAATLPAALYHLGTVQALLLIAGITALALYWLDKRPLTAGALVGLMVIKPHLALLWPVLLALSGRWRAFTAAAASSVVLVSAAGLIFGFESYARFFENLRASQGLVSGQTITTPAYASLYGNLLMMHASQAVAITAQVLSAVCALIAAAWTFRRGGFSAQAAAFCAATLLLSHYLFFYDFTLLAVGAAFLGIPRNRFETVALVFAWAAGLSLPLGYYLPMPLAPFAAWLVLIAALRRAGSADARLAPALRM